MNRRDFLIGATSAIAGAAVCPSRSFAQNGIDLSAIRNRDGWRVQRDRILAGMHLVMGQRPDTTGLALGIVTLESEEKPVYTRRKITYLSERGDDVPAYLLIPTTPKRRAPAMVCLHQTIKTGKDEPAGLGGNPNLHYAKELAERGYVCIVPDYPYLGENAFDPYQHGYVSCTMKGIVNHMRAVDVLQSLSEVDPARIGSIGHSLGGHNTLFVAAFDDRVKAMVTSCGFTSMRKYGNGNLAGWAGRRYMPRIADQYGNDPALMPFDFPHILVALAPRPLFINAPLHDSNFDVSGVRDCVDAAMPVYDRVFRAKARLVANYPDAGHEFPSRIRAAAYEFLDKWLA
jgi:dienelactone hydrolase